MPILIAENVLLMLLDDQGTFVSGDNRRPALGGAVLAELALAGAIEIETEKGLWKRTRTLVADAEKVTDPLLAGAVEEIAATRRSPQDLVNRLGKNLPDRLCGRLVDRGVLGREESKIMGLFTQTRWPIADAQYKTALRASLRRALVDGEDPDAQTATVIAVLFAAGVLPKVVDRGPLSKRDLKARAEAIADGDWASEAVRKAIQAAQAAVVAAVTATTAVAASGS